MGTINTISIEQEVKKSYLDYAMSVIVSRALPDVRDGLKPVQRRILYGMWRLNLKPGAKFAKSARIVGTILGYYHPHGDASVYEALARMAQDFSLRYPLIAGQGNFGCFTKDTKVKLTDGRNVSLEKLIKEDGNGKKNYTYTVNSAGLISIAEIKNPRLTRRDTEVMKVTLDNGEEIRCTLNHPFLLRDGTYKEAKDLHPGESLMPLHERLSEKTDRLNREGYYLIYQAKRDEWVPAHHLADNYNLTAKKYSKTTGRVRHHRDFNKLNNNPDNIVRVHWGEHWRIHYEQASRLHKKEEYRRKIAEGRRRYWSQPAHRALHARRLTERNKRNWQNPEYRRKMVKFLSEVNKEYIKNHPERRIEFSQRASRTLKRLWQVPVYRKLFHEKIVAANRKRVTNNTGKVKFLKVCQAIFQKYRALNQEAYERERKIIYGYGHATSWQTGIEKYYDNNLNGVREALTKNHKVERIEFLQSKEDVYDLTIEKSHNFALGAGVFAHNSIDGDSPAQMRYTEAKLMHITEAMLDDVDKETVGWKDTFDGTRKEPEFLPSKLPQLLLNGAQGIAVGMATNIPPHNVSEVIDALLYLLSHPKAALDELLQFIKGPDFPTGGIIYDGEAIKTAYATGRGAIPLRARIEIKEEKAGKYLVVLEVPYQVAKSDLITEIAELVRLGKIEGIQDIIDGSRKDAINIVIELKRSAQPQKVLNQLYHHTRLQKNYNLLAIALVDGIEPRLLSLPELLRSFLEHRERMVRRRLEFELKEARERAHILEGLALALSHIDAVIGIIKKSGNREEAKTNLQKEFRLSEKQCEAILLMRLQTLARLEREAITAELGEKQKLIQELLRILASPAKIREIIKSELHDIKKRFGDKRKTQVELQPLTQFSAVDLIPQERTLIMLTKDGYIKRVAPKTFTTQGRGGVGINGIALGQGDVVIKSVGALTHDDLLFFSRDGKMFLLKAYEIPEKTRIAKGEGLYEFFNTLSPICEVSVVSAQIKEDKHAYLAAMSKRGLIKKVLLQAFSRIPKKGIKIMNLSPGDECLKSFVASGKSELLALTQKGKALRFSLGEIRAMGRQAAGVKGMRIGMGDELVDLVKVQSPEDEILFITENGFGKKVKVRSFSLHHRGTSGMRALTITSRTGPIKTALHVPPESQSLLINSLEGKAIKIELKRIPLLGRAAQGVRLIRLHKGDKVASALLL